MYGPRFLLISTVKRAVRPQKLILMKRLLKVVVCLAVLASGTSVVNAQGLGGLINKAKAAVKKAEKSSSDNKAENPEETSILKTVTSSGIGISNPVSSFIEIEPIGLYGVSKSENFGDAYLVLKVKNLIPKDKTSFGSSVQNQKMIAVDPNGKVYNTDASGVYGFDTPEGLIIQVIMDQPGLMFTDIRKDINMMQQVKFGVIQDAYHQGNVTLTNVPIFWDKLPE